MPRTKDNSRQRNIFGFIKGLIIRLAVISVVVSLAVLFIAAAVVHLAKTSDYFRVREVIIGEGNIADLSYLEGENIFALDLTKESRYILEHYPAYRKIRLVRILPDRIFADFLKRKPVAWVKLYRIFSVDQDMVLFEAPVDTRPPDLPVITGLETKIFGPKVGRRYNIKELSFALNTLKAFRFNRILRFYKVKRIDAANINNASVFVALPVRPMPSINSAAGGGLAAWIEIKLDEDWFKDKVGILAMLLMQTKNDLPNIKYIDLRFKDPLIKLKDDFAK